MRAFGILFFQQKQSGWSEVYPLNTASYASAAAALASIATERLELALPDVILIGSRVSDTDVKGDSSPSGISVPALGTWTAVGSEATMQTDYALRLKVFAGTALRSSRFVRGIPFGNLSTDGSFSPEAGYLTKLNDYIAALITNASVGTRIKGAVAPPFYAFSPITSISVLDMERRQVGRPFGQPRGRRVIA